MPSAPPMEATALSAEEIGDQSVIDAIKAQAEKLRWRTGFVIRGVRKPPVAF